VWDSNLRKYILRFEPAVELIRTRNNKNDNEADVIANTAKFTKVLEDVIRRYPDQWLWVHRRWKTRPPGEPPLY
jgi:KDO2-lipid IV(A) lauroyltransferase